MRCAPGIAIGREVLRQEDRRLITGAGTYTADINLPGQAFAKIVRSPYAHAAILAIDCTAALAVPGVLSVLTGADLVADDLGAILHDHALLGTEAAQKRGPDIYLANIDGSPSAIPPHHLLAIDRVRFIGEAVAIVIADNLAATAEAAELVSIDYNELPAVISSAIAVQDGAPLVWDHIPRNVSIEAEVGNRSTTDAAFAVAAHTVRLDTHIQRITGSPMEPRAAVGDYDSRTGQYTLYAPCSGVVRHLKELSAILKVPPARIRVLAKDVGGSFGTRNAFYPEFGLVAWGSCRITKAAIWRYRLNSPSMIKDGFSLSVGSTRAISGPSLLPIFPCGRESDSCRAFMIFLLHISLAGPSLPTRCLQHRCAALDGLWRGSSSRA
jgi:carbon-monoxide dehydrogenase large subunit